jgi:hypothetical protein
MIACQLQTSYNQLQRTFGIMHLSIERTMKAHPRFVDPT